MNPAIKQAGQLRQQLQADIAKLLNAYTAATGLRVTSLDHDTTLGRGTEPATYTVSVEVRL
jgi:hypothetical protein